LQLSPPYTHPISVSAALAQQGFALLPAADVAALSACNSADLEALRSSWNHLAVDTYLNDGSMERCFETVASATQTAGRPTPAGAHRDGVDLVAVFLAAREGVKGGETRVFDAHGPTGVRFTLTEPWSVLLLDDAKAIHETTPIHS
jgi:hypothetical protein